MRADWNYFRRLAEGRFSRASCSRASCRAEKLYLPLGASFALRTAHRTGMLVICALGTKFKLLPQAFSAAGFSDAF